MFYSAVGSRSLCRTGSRPLCAPWYRILIGSALSSGACRWRVRLSSRSFSGAVVVVGFRSRPSALVFATAWSSWIRVPVAVRPFSGSVFGVSIPVAVPPSLALSPASALPSSVVWVS